MDSTELENNNTNINILVLGPKTRSLLSTLLNPTKLLRNDKGIPRDWQGLAELCGISGELIPSISHSDDQTGKILKLWYEQSKTDATVDKLISYLEQLDRSDVVNDILPEIAEDLKLYNEHPPNGKTVEPLDVESDKFILTIDDVDRISKGLPPQFYDAFVLFAQEDIDFATEVIETMEKTFDLKFCVKERDLVAGLPEHDAVIKLIAERCGRLVVILSPAFLQSNVNKFFYSLAQSISIEQRARKIIPCIYKDCDKLPPELDCYFKLDFRRSGTFWNFWDKLHDSIKMPEKPRAKLSLPENSLFNGVSLSAESKIGNPVFRSVSNSEQYLSPAGLKPSLHKDTSEPRSISQSVKFSSSMSNLPNTEVPEDKIVPCTSANSLGRYEEKTVKKTISFFKRIRSSIIPKSKAEKQRSNDLQANETLEENHNVEKAPETFEERNGTKDIQINHDKKKKEKKKVFTLKRNKKKSVLVDT